jgi:hypothetical protein
MTLAAGFLWIFIDIRETEASGLSVIVDRDPS